MNTETATVNTPAATAQAPEAPARPRPARPVRWARPALDVLEREDALVLLFDVPGVRPADLEIRTEGRRLTVKGLRAGTDRGWFRELALPEIVDPARIEARADSGVLTLTLHRSEAARPRRIEVR